MKKFERKYKDKFLENLPAKNNLDEIKRQLSFEKESLEVNLKPRRKPTLIFSLSTICCALIALIVAILFIKNPAESNNVPTFLRMEIVDDKPKASNNIIDATLPSGLKYPDVSYYAKPGDSVTVAIYLENLKQYEILSFSLGQQLYSSYMFKDGSTTEVIYVDIKASDMSGVQTIYIDKIKYVDGTEIKEANYNGERTLYLGVEYTNLPSLKVNKEDVSYNQYTLDFELSNYSLLTDDVLYNAYLIKNEEIVDTKKLKVSDKKLIFENLEMNSDYEVAILCNLDILNGKGFKPIYLYESKLTTKCGLNDLTINSTYNTIKVNYSAHTSVINVTSKLYKDNVLIKEIKDSNIIFSGLLSNNSYDLEIEYTYLLNGKLINNVIKQTIKTKEYTNIPSANGLIFSLDNSIFYEVNLNDTDKLIKSYEIEVIGDSETLYKGDILSNSIKTTKNYSVLLVKVKIAYDLCDGLGERVITTTIK